MQTNALSLSLLVLGVLFVNHVDASLPTNNFVVRTPLFDACPNFHRSYNALKAGTANFIVAYGLLLSKWFVHGQCVKLTCSGTRFCPSINRTGKSQLSRDRPEES